MSEVRSIAEGDAFHILQNARRRAVLCSLLAHDDQEQFVVRTLAEAVAAWEHDTTVERLTSDHRQRVYIALYQSHLPKLDDHGVIDYDRSRGTVDPTALLAVFARYVEPGLSDAEDRLSVPAEDDGATGSGLADVVSTLLSE